MKIVMRKRIEKNRILKIDDEIKNDRRLYPLLNVNSKLHLQIYLLEITNLSTREKNYRIVYGWCFKTTREEISIKVTFRNEFTSLFKTELVEYSINKLNMFNTAETIINIINNLLSGNSFLEATKKESLKTNNIKFDVKLPINDMVIRPIIFNETNSLISRNMYKKNVFISPYKSVPSFSLIINNLNKEGILKDDTGHSYDRWELAILKLLNYLQEDTTLPFKTSNSARFGNIELINTQCCNEFQVHNVRYEHIKEEVNIDHEKETCCKKVRVTIKPNIHTCDKNLLINCFLLNGEQVILDECKKIFHSDGNTEYIEFESKEPISEFSISIWLEENNNFQIWYKNSAVLIREISTNIGTVGMNGVVRSHWLDTIKNSNARAKKQVGKAEETSKASYHTITTENYKLDPWVKSDRNFSSLINQLSPEKSNAEFFSKGWDSTDDSHGAISFLEWFKRITDKAQEVVIQDPFYDTLGLEFVARTTNAETEFFILTCTQITSLDDSDNTLGDKSEPNRAKRLKSFIKSNPSLFGYLKLNIYDIGSSGGGGNNLIHDRYLLIFEDNLLKTGFHLSNSIQGATRKHPLLITPIPKDVLKKVDNYINEIIEQPIKKKLEPSLSDDKVIANENIYKILKDKIPSSEYVQEDIIKSIVCNTSYVKNEKFSDFWSTFGDYLASSQHADEIIAITEKVIDSNFKINLRKYLEDSINSEPPLGFFNVSALENNDFQFIFKDDFDKILKESLSIGEYLHEAYSYKNWGVYFGCELLLNSDFNEYIKLIKFIQQQYSDKENDNLVDSPLPKLSSNVFAKLYEQLFQYGNVTIIIKAIECDEVNYIQAIGASSLINILLGKGSEIRYSEAKELLINNLETDEVLSVLIAFLFKTKFKKYCENSTHESQIFAVISQLLINHFNEDRLKNLLNCLLHSSYPYPLIEKKITELILFKLKENGKITNNDIYNLWSIEFFRIIEECKGTKDYSGVVNLTGRSLQIIDDETKNSFINRLNKIYKKSCNEIRTPFKKGSVSWNTSFEKILLIRTVLIIAVLYEDENKSKYNDKMRDLIKNIEILEIKYQFNMSHSKIYKFSKQILERYNS